MRETIRANERGAVPRFRGLDVRGFAPSTPSTRNHPAEEASPFPVEVVRFALWTPQPNPPVLVGNVSRVRVVATATIARRPRPFVVLLERASLEATPLGNTVGFARGLGFDGDQDETSCRGRHARLSRSWRRCFFSFAPSLRSASPSTRRNAVVDPGPSPLASS